MWRALVALVVSTGVAIAQPSPMPDRAERVIGAARVWAKAKFFHPYLAYKDIDWDAAFVSALPKIEAASTIDQYKAALTEMLGKLGDPVTRIGDTTPPAAPTGKPGTALSWPEKNIALVDMAAFVAGGWDSPGFRTRGDEIEKAVANAKVIIVDLRTPEPAWLASAAQAYFAKALPTVEEWPVQRVLEHRGYRSQEGTGSGSYFSTFVTMGARPGGKPQATGPQHAVFIADPRSALPVEAIALQANGRATIVATGALDPSGTVETIDVALPGDITATVRLGELLWGAPTADITTKDPRARALDAAKAAAKAPKKAVRQKPRQELAPLRVRDDLDYPDQLYPSRELRVLAAVRIWATLDAFFPYRYLITDWDAVLREMLPRLEAAPDRKTYIDVLREMGARGGDGHIGVAIAAIDPTIKLRGTIGATLRLVENKVTVVRVWDESKALALGDVVETVDGKAVSTILAEKRPITSGSTTEAREQRIAYSLGFGDDQSTAKLGVRDAQGKLREVSVPRKAANLKTNFDPANAQHWKKLPNNIGFVNLMLLTVPEVPTMLDELKDTRAIIFDLRGYPNGVLFSLTPRLNAKGAKYGAQFLLPLVTGTGGDQRVRFFQDIAEVSALPKGTAIYKGKVVVLIDDRAVSQSEHTCLFLSEAAGATFVGSPTHGANGDITAMRLPGGLRMWFTGQEVRWVDGRQLQKIGVQPNIPIRPTIAGVRAGKDEVLERAVRFVETGK